MSTLQKNCAAIELNNQGVAHIEAGQYGYGMQSLKCSLEALKTLIVVAEESNHKGQQHPECRAANFHWSDLPVGEEITCEDSFVFRRAIRITSSGTPSVALPTMNEFAAVLYNTALANHLCCLRRGMQCAKLVRKTAMLYDMALELIDTESPSSFAFLFALLNNRGHVQNELGMFEEARGSYRALREKWHAAIEHDAVTDYLNEKDYHGLFLNLVVFSNPSDMAPAA